MKTTEVFDTYWHFTAERHAMYMRRLAGDPGPWTNDAILRAHRFTNVFRASDRVSQFLIAEVQYGAHRSQAPTEVAFRTLLFKLFNRIETWKLLESELGPISWQATDLTSIDQTLGRAFARGVRLYSAAYIMPSPPFGATRKHSNHIALLGAAMEAGLPTRLAAADSLQDVYTLLAELPGIGRFLAFQFAIDLNYSSFLHFHESTFVIAGPGALDGIAKCFSNTDGRTPEEVIHWMVDHQEAEFERRGIEPPTLFGRRLQPIDCQNLFCEISKYARVAHPTIRGLTDRNRIKQRYRADSERLPDPFFPPRWKLVPPKRSRVAATTLFDFIN